MSLGIENCSQSKHASTTKPVHNFLREFVIRYNADDFRVVFINYVIDELDHVGLSVCARICKENKIMRIYAASSKDIDQPQIKASGLFSRI